MAEILRAEHPGLLTACGVLQVHSMQLIAPSLPSVAATEAAGVAAVALTGVFEQFRAVFGQRLLSVSAALGRAADAYETMDEDNSQAVQVV
jgi:hypothetical protein